MALFTVTTNSYVNLPPSQVGNNSVTTDYGVSYAFSVADFTTNTTPVYADPEGDSAATLKITSLPATGTLEFNSVAVVVNDTIAFTGTPSIANGNLIYIPDNGTTTAYSDNFNFEIADSGSGTFVG